MQRFKNMEQGSLRTQNEECTVEVVLVLVSSSSLMCSLSLSLSLCALDFSSLLCFFLFLFLSLCIVCSLLAESFPGRVLFYPGEKPQRQLLEASPVSPCGPLDLQN